ncbi:MAG: hypothetical protein P8182_04890 [Deltaproteobacteria bacterium]
MRDRLLADMEYGREETSWSRSSYKKSPQHREERMIGGTIWISALACVTVKNLWEDLCGEKRVSAKAAERARVVTYEPNVLGANFCFFQ